MAITRYINAQEFRKSLLDKIDQSTNRALALLKMSTAESKLEEIYKERVKAEVLMSVVSDIDALIENQ